MTLDFSGDMALADNTESVTVTIKRAGGETPIAVTGSLRRVLDQSHRFFGGVTLQGNEIVWNIPDDQLSGSELQRGDTVTDGASVVWTILTVAKLTFGTRWRCVCRKEQ